MSNNIGKLNAIFLQNVENLLRRKDGRKLMREYTLMFTKNKSLLKEYMVFDYIEKINNSENLKDYISEGINQLNNINKITLSGLNEIVSKFMSDNNINQLHEIENEKLYESIDELIFTKKNIKTINERVDKLNNIVEYIKETKPLSNCDDDKNFIITENIDSLLMLTVNNFNKKYDDMLTEEEKVLFKTITTPNNDTEKQVIFEDNRKECLLLTNEFLKEAIDNTTKEKLLNVKEKLLEQKYDKNKYISDILSFIELKQTLSE